MENNKFILTDESKVLEDGTEVFRIQALVSFNNVTVGDYGGFVESEDNLSAEENDISWIYDDAVVYGASTVEADSIVYKGAEVNNSHVINHSRIAYDSIVDTAHVQDSQIQSSTVKDTASYSSTIGQSVLEDSEIVFSTIGDTTVKHSFIESSETSYGSTIQHSHVEDQTLREKTLHHYDSRMQLGENDLDGLKDETGKSL